VGGGGGLPPPPSNEDGSLVRAVAKNFLSNLFSLQFYMDEFKQGGCYRAFLNALFDALNPLPPPVYPRQEIRPVRPTEP